MQKNTFLDSAIARDLQLGRTKCGALIKNVLSPYFTKKLLEDIGSNYFSLIIDESTDIATKKQLGIVIRYYSASGRRFINTFLKLVELSNSTAEGIVDAVLKTLQEYKLNISKLKGLGTDNASTMVGRNKGVIALLQKLNSDIILIPCVCHSIQLAVSRASEYIPHEIEFLISETYNWFAKSASRQNSYKQIFSSINDGIEPYKLVRACDTRWLSIETAVKRIAGQWIELKTHFGITSRKEKCHKAKILYNLYTDANMAYLIFLKPVLHEVQKLNKSFESNTADPTKLFSDLKTLLYTYCSQVVLYSEEFDPLLSPLTPFLIPTPYFSYDFEEYIKLKLNEGSINDEMQKIIRKNCQLFVIELVNQLRQRLPDNMNSLEKINFFSVENSLKVTKRDIFAHFEEEKSRYTSSQIALIELQWRKLITVQWTSVSTIEFWAEVREYKNALNETPFLELVEFVFSFLVLPLSNAEVERIFSAMNILKTKLRNRLKTKMLHSLLNIRCSLKRVSKCCDDFEISDDLTSMVNARNLYETSSSSGSSDEDDII